MPKIENPFDKPASSSSLLSGELARQALSSESNLLQEAALKSVLGKTLSAVSSDDRIAAKIVAQLAESKLDEPNKPLAKPEAPRYFESVSQIGSFGGALAFKYNTYAGAGLVFGAGAYQTYKDLGYMSKAEGLAQRAKFTAALGADIFGLMGGSALSLTKYGPKWLAPALMAGGFAGRLAVDLIPDKPKK